LKKIEIKNEIKIKQNDTVRTQIGSRDLKAVKTVKQIVEVFLSVPNTPPAPESPTPQQKYIIEKKQRMQIFINE
jgi:hypothetical protein